MASVLVVNASPRPNSNSSALSAKVAEGVAANGHNVSTVEIGKADIHPCIGCDSCKKNPGVCVFKDSMVEFYSAVTGADIIVFAGPIYYFCMNAQTKLFIDRLYALAEGATTGKRIAAVFVYGDEDPFKAGCGNAIRVFQDICAYTGAKWSGAVYGTALKPGEAAANPELLEKAMEFGKTLR